MTTINSGAFAPVVFQFQSTNIRTFADDNGEPWFCANDVCEVLGYANSRQAVQKNCLEKGVSKRDTLTGGGNQELTFINEGNLYRLIVKSRKPEAEKFEQQVMDEILPAIRKTGSYQHKQESLPAIDVNQIEKLIQKQLQKSLPVSLNQIKPPVWTKPDPVCGKDSVRNIETTRLIIRELKTWANSLQPEIGGQLWDALDDLDKLMVTCRTEIDEALLHMVTGQQILKRWLGRNTESGYRKVIEPKNK